MSASTRPTFFPCLANDTAKFTAIVDLPTPPLPEATAINSTGLSLDNNPSIVCSSIIPLNFSNVSSDNSSKRIPTVLAPLSFNRSTISICKSSCGCPPILAIAILTLMCSFSSLTLTSTIPPVSLIGTSTIGSCNSPTNSLTCSTDNNATTSLLLVNLFVSYSV